MLVIASLLDYTFIIIILAYITVIAFRVWQTYFQVKRNLDVDITPLYVKLLTLRKKGVTDAYLNDLPTRW